MTAEHTLMLRIGALTFEIAQLTAERDRLAAENAELRAERGGTAEPTPVPGSAPAEAPS